jgi:hypothetical protein
VARSWFGKAHWSAGLVREVFQVSERKRTIIVYSVGAAVFAVWLYFACQPGMWPLNPSEATAAVPRTTPLPRAPEIPTETQRGFIQPIVDGWTKTFVLASEPSANWGGYPLSFTTKEMYGAFERNEGMLAEVELIRASRGHEECFVVVSFRVLE